jgi:CheY-like chemotaxis protein
VLLVEDNDFAQKLFRHAVKRFHYEWRDGGSLQVIGAGDGLDALKLLEQTPIDLAIVDFFLPSLGGAELIRRMRGDPRWAHVPVLVISVGGDGVREEALAAGADLYLDKPVLLKQLLTTLHLLIGAPHEATAALDEAP